MCGQCERLRIPQNCFVKTAGAVGALDTQALENAPYFSISYI